MYAQDLIEILCAAHLSSYVQSPYEERGGLLLVAPPGALKSTFLEELDKHYPDALSLTDLNAKAMAQLRDRIVTGTVRTVVFPEFQKLYDRKDDTAMNLEGTIRALVAEGFRAAAFESQGINRIRARAMVIGAMTPATQARRFDAWEESGFNRRFLWPLFRLANPMVLDDAIVEWRRLRFAVGRLPQLPFGEQIPQQTTRDERQALRMMCKYQPGGHHTQQLQLLVKTLSVLRWWYDFAGLDRDPWAVMQRFGVSLGREGAVLELEQTNHRSRRTKAERQLERKAAARKLAKARWAKRKGRK